jgi:hypothetical protein
MGKIDREKRSVVSGLGSGVDFECFKGSKTVSKSTTTKHPHL